MKKLAFLILCVIFNSTYLYSTTYTEPCISSENHTPVNNTLGIMQINFPENSTNIINLNYNVNNFNDQNIIIIDVQSLSFELPSNSSINIIDFYRIFEQFITNYLSDITTLSGIYQIQFPSCIHFSHTIDPLNPMPNTYQFEWCSIGCCYRKFQVVKTIEPCSLTEIKLLDETNTQCPESEGYENYLTKEQYNQLFMIYPTYVTNEKYHFANCIDFCNIYSFIEKHKFILR